MKRPVQVRVAREAARGAAARGGLVGRRVVVYGPTGSGKTTVARRIGELLDLPVVELDAVFWRPNWEPTPADEFRPKALHTLGTHGRGWVCDGNYSMLRDAILPMADTVVWLRPPFLVAYWRLLRRTIARIRTKELLWGNNFESWRPAFLSRDSLLLFAIGHWRKHFKGVAQDLEEIPHRATVVKLRSSQQVEGFLASLATGAAD
jgi:adenylate kinase family enzyme